LRIQFIQGSVGEAASVDKVKRNNNDLLEEKINDTRATEDMSNLNVQLEKVLFEVCRTHKTIKNQRIARGSNLGKYVEFAIHTYFQS
jgi:hypothetical protein